MATNALWVNGLSIEDARLNMAALITKNSYNALDVRTGVLFFGDGTLVYGTATTAPSMTVSVDRLHFVGLKSTAEGPYIGCIDTVATLNIAAAPASGSRIDVVYVMQRDADATASPDGVTAGEVGVVTGVSGTTPTKPSIPAGAVEVGTVTVAAGATKTTDAQVTIATTARWTCLQGTPIPVRNTTERAALPSMTGLQCMRLDKGGLVQRWDGSKWRGARSYAARYSIDPTVAGGGYQTVTHGAGFTPVAVVVTGYTSGLQFKADSFTSSTFRVQQINSDGSAGGDPMDINVILYEAED